ncbi:MAG: RHS repeat-associated core domain-containing protein, partial [Chloroflexi bacterium]|nr:RHS repeat-associated core domain-containing protein [Chloroflexota bacterium]
LDYSGYDQGTPAFRLVETAPACYQSVTATSPSLAMVNSNELSGTVPSAGTYAGHVFTDAPTPATPGITTVYPSGCQPVSGSLRFWWTLPACWTWTNYTYVLRNLDTGHTQCPVGDVTSGSTTATEVTLAVDSATNYRLTVTGHKTGYADVSQSTEVFIAYPVPTNLQPSGQVPAGDTTFTWTSGVSEMEVHYRLYRVNAPPHWPPLELITEGTTTAGAVTLTLAPPTPPATQQEYRFTVQATAACNLGLAQTTVWTVATTPTPTPAPCDPIQNGGFSGGLAPWTGSGLWASKIGHDQLGAVRLTAPQYVQQIITPGQTGMILHVWGRSSSGTATLRVWVKNTQIQGTYADQSFTLGTAWTHCQIAVSDAAVGQACEVRLSSTSGTVYADDVSITCEGGKPPEGATVGGWAQAVAGPGDWHSRPAGLAAPVATQSAQQQPVIVTKYYTFNGKRVATRRGKDGNLTFLHGDHLGSTSLTTDEDGGDAVQQWYYPYGGQRAADGDLPTDYRFTGQRHDSYINLYQMGDRWYNAELGRWISPDPIIPEPGNPQALNRYSYVYNNPLKYIDPTGHWADSGDTDVEEQQNADPPPPPPMGTWEYIRWLLTLVPEGQEVLTYINSHGTKIYIIGSLQDAGNSLYPNNMIILNASRFSAQDLATQIDVAGDIGHEVEHQIWGPRGALWPSREQEGAAFA